MNRLSSIKKISLAVLVGLSVALSPVASMADKGGYKGHSAKGSSYSATDRYDHVKPKSHADHKGHPGSEKHHVSHKHGKVHYVRGHGHHRGHVHHPVRHHRETIVVHEPVIEKHYVRRHYVHGNALDSLSLMLGLHFDNVDIFVRH